MRAKTYKLLALVGTMLVLTVANVVMADNSPTQDSAFAPVVADASQCTVIVQPGQSIQSAIVPARSGAVICVRAGVYTEQIKLKATNAGVTLMAYPGEKPILDGKNQVPPVTKKNSTPSLLLVDGPNITVDGFEVRNSTSRGVNVSKSGVIVRNLIVRDNKNIGLLVSGSSSVPVRNVLVENTVVYNNLLKNAGGTAGGSALTFIQAEDSTARGNRVYHNYGEGLVAGRFTRNIVFEDNTTYDNRGANLYMVNTINPIIRRNFIFCTNDPISWRGNGGGYRPGPGLQIRDEDFKPPQPPPSSGQVIVNNIVVGCGLNFGVSSQIANGGLNNAIVANNTFVNARSVSGESANNIEFDGRASFRNTRFVNNVIVQTVPGTITRIQYATGTPDLSTFTVTNNLYSKAPTNGWVSTESGRIVADAQLVNPIMPLLTAMPTPAGYALKAASPAVDRGANVAQVTEDFFKTARSGVLDIGADELGGSTNFKMLVDLLSSPDSDG
ncbi:MAG: right-handed parallel beta-helix repeat-containing protein [Candidatus Promineofilum sp.]|nr:right-handed parallel beta-helix repeat-containing protein [Promineifilum sp.]